MKRYMLVTGVNALFLLSNCRSQQAFMFQSATAVHGVAREETPETPVPTAVVAPLPDLTAELPMTPTSRSLPGPSPARAVWLPKTARLSAARVALPATSQVLPDTSLVRASSDIPIRKIKETDLFTKILRVIGASVVVFGILLLITAFTTTASGWTALAFFIYGFAVILFSIPFFVFKGKNSPRRQELERRRAARKAAGH